MVIRSMRNATIAIFWIVGPMVLPSAAQQPAAGTSAVQIIGLAGVKHKTKGTLALDGGDLQFEYSKTKANVPLRTIDDVVTDLDSERVFRGTVGTLTMFAPYGSGRFLSLFRSKIDTLTIKYRDESGALHGAIFTMALGKAEPFKKEMLAGGARTTIPIQDHPANTDAKPGAAKEKKP
jgi:hypothetical protein